MKRLLAWLAPALLLALVGTMAAEGQRTGRAAASAGTAAGFLAWETDASGARTDLLDGQGAPIASYPAIVVSDGRRLWALERDRREVTLPTCAQLDGDSGFPPSSPSRAEVTSLWLRDLESRERRVLVAEPGDLDVVAELDQHVTLTASLGSFVFVRQSVYPFGCGAHGEVVAVARAGQAPGPTEATLRVDEPSARARASSELLARWRTDDPESVEVESVAPSELSIVETLPFWRAGQLRARVRMIAGVAYAFSDGSWSSYERSTIVESDTLPPALTAEARAIPAAVLSRLDREGRGVSRLTAAGLTVARGAFRAPEASSGE